MRVRLSGVLLHISSLPSAYGIGDLGPEAHAFARLLADAGQSVWQFLPLNPTSPAIGNSPYSSPSAFAGNPLFISPELLYQDGVVSLADLESSCKGPYSEGLVNYEQVGAERELLLRLAFERNRHRLHDDSAFSVFRAAHAHWLLDYARFTSIKQAHGGASWVHWPSALARRDPQALAAWDHDHAADIQRECFIQYLFFSQWARLKELCCAINLRLVGDVPIYVTHDSADVWANPRYFSLDENFFPVGVAGVPPDYFSATGQRWGNPVYRWDILAQDDFRWWHQRLEHNLLLADSVRLDHFRAFAGYWEIAAHEETAINGKWVKAPGQALFASLARRLETLPFLAEDLGVITPDVQMLKRDFSLPGMKVLQFAFGGDSAENPHMPFLHEENSFVYTGTHDNSTTRDWIRHLGPGEQATLRRYVGHEVTEENASAVLIRMALSSVAHVAVVPMQDVLDLGAEARMNTPSVAAGNWVWRLHPQQMTAGNFADFSRQCCFFGRGPVAGKAALEGGFPDGYPVGAP